MRGHGVASPRMSRSDGENLFNPSAADQHPFPDFDAGDLAGPDGGVASSPTDPQNLGGRFDRNRHPGRIIARPLGG
jgi:hypothetical protein